MKPDHPKKSSSRPQRKSGIVVPQRPKWHGRLTASTLWLVASGLSKSWRVTLQDESGLFQDPSKGPVIFALWHNRLSVAMTFWSWVRRRQPKFGLAALISASRDGGLLATTFENFGVKPVRGSSSKRGPQALIELVSAIREGHHVAITPDGPRGPKYVVQPGIIALAQLSGVPIVPAGARISPRKEMRSWDSFQVPLPFARCELAFGKPVRISRDAPEGEREAARSALQAELLRINPD